MLTRGAWSGVLAGRVIPVEYGGAVCGHDRRELGDVAVSGCSPCGRIGECKCGRCKCKQCERCDDMFHGGSLAFAPYPDAGKLIMPDFAGGGKLRGLRAE